VGYTSFSLVEKKKDAYTIPYLLKSEKIANPNTFLQSISHKFLDKLKFCRFFDSIYKTIYDINPENLYSRYFTKFIKNYKRFSRSFLSFFWNFY
jgi:hypothetical protein